MVVHLILISHNYNDEKFIGFIKKCLNQRKNKPFLKRVIFPVAREFTLNDGYSCQNPYVSSVNAQMNALFTELSQGGVHTRGKVSSIASGDKFRAPQAVLSTNFFFLNIEESYEN